MIFWLHRLGGILLSASAACAIPGLVNLGRDDDSKMVYQRLLSASGVLLIAGAALLVVP